MTRVLVVDDEPQLTAALHGALTRSGYDVTAAGDGEMGVELAATWAPDLMVLDLSMPGLHGLEVITRVRAWSDVPILVLSGVSEVERKAEALDSGADDYLQKPFGLDELQARLRALERRAVRAESEPARRYYGGLEVDLVSSHVTLDGSEVRLTPTEWRVLTSLLSHPNQLLTHRWLLQEVWDHRHGEETREALRTHVRTLRAKIGDRATDPLFIRTESGSGYRWVGRAHDAAVDASAVRRQSQSAGVVHELANATTALRMAAQLVCRSRAEQSGAANAHYELLDSLSARVTELVSHLREQEDQ